jgi:hypothetical protein
MPHGTAKSKLGVSPSARTESNWLTRPTPEYWYAMNDLQWPTTLISRQWASEFNE